MWSQFPIFTVEQLDNQVRVFNLTKYVYPNSFKSMSPSGSAVLPSNLLDVKSDLKPVSPPTYIPPHRRLNNSSHSPNPNYFHGSAQPNSRDKPVHISIDDVENSWLDCLKKGIFAIWTGPSKDIHPLMEWLSSNCQE